MSEQEDLPTAPSNIPRVSGQALACVVLYAAVVWAASLTAAVGFLIVKALR